MTATNAEIIERLSSILESQTAKPKTRNDEKQRLYTPDETAEKLKVNKQTLAIWRCTGRYNLAYIKVGRNIRYTGEAIDSFLERRTVTQEFGA